MNLADIYLYSIPINELDLFINLLKVIKEFICYYLKIR